MGVQVKNGKQYFSDRYSASRYAGNRAAILTRGIQTMQRCCHMVETPNASHALGMAQSDADRGQEAGLDS